MKTNSFLTIRPLLAPSLASCVALIAPAAFAQGATTSTAVLANTATPNAEATVPNTPAAETTAPIPATSNNTGSESPRDTAPSDTAPSDTATEYHLGAHAEVDLGILAALRQGTAIAGGVVWGPFRAGLSYASFLSNNDFGGTPEGFSLRANYIIGINASYFIAQSSDDGLYVQGMFHIKQQGVTNDSTGDHKDLNSLAAGLELGYVWKVYQGLYVAPRVGALYYVKSPQGKHNDPIRIGNRDYDNGRHKVFDTYFIPTLSVGYSW